MHRPAGLHRPGETPERELTHRSFQPASPPHARQRTPPRATVDTLAEDSIEAALALQRAEHARLIAAIEARTAAERRLTDDARARRAELIDRRAQVRGALTHVEGRIEALQHDRRVALAGSVHARKLMHVGLRLLLTAAAFGTSLFCAAPDGRGGLLLPALALQGAAVWWLGDLADREALRE